MRIGDLARIVGTSTRAVRHYHRIGLLPEPARESNGYRTYTLDDVVLLLRVRRLVALGMSLDEIGDVLDEDERGRDLDELLAELDADLARQAEAIEERRHRLAEMRRAEPGRPVPNRVGAIADRLAEAYAGYAGTARVELAMMEVLTGVVPGAVEIYETALDDPEVVALSGDIAADFEALADAEPDDPRIVAVADRIVAAADRIHLAVSERSGPARIAVDDVAGWFEAADWMCEAQRRCGLLMVQRLAERRSA
ncbi:MerR family transcriptional regulator [Tsukamurella pseudospumae]|uniref:HTH merR-type domain-containing protein n=1 Tax=Tsukamurella pseudospumae TaxID=239498 RepID=A0A137YUQ9_9ACTN|nr:MerR family transcriptional regulator [Tsukamurella pseudospumae]KXO89563.1 hypothetical protein AXK61_09025 [Tsukamurella pseudospumae]